MNDQSIPSIVVIHELPGLAHVVRSVLGGLDLCIKDVHSVDKVVDLAGNYSDELIITTCQSVCSRADELLEWVARHDHLIVLCDNKNQPGLCSVPLCSRKKQSDMSDSELRALILIELNIGDSRDSRPRLLLVDDCRMSIKVATEVLQGEFCISSFYRPADAAEALEFKKFDILLTDFRMEGMTGVELIRLASRLQPSLISIMMTGYGDKHIVLEAMQAGASDFIEKPIRIDSLRISMARGLEKVKSEQEKSSLIQALSLSNVSLQEREAQIRAIVESAQEGILTFDATGTILTANSSVYEMFGYESGALIGAKIEKLIPVVSSACSEIGRESGGLRANRSRKEVAGYRDDESKLDLSMSLTYEKDGSIEFFTGILCDLTEEKIAESERRSLEVQVAQQQNLESIGQLAAGIAHEINTPVQFVSDNSHFLADAFGDLGKIIEVAQQVASGKFAGDLEGLVAKFKVIVETADCDYLQEEIPRAIEQSLEGLERIGRIVCAMKEFAHPAADRSSADINQGIRSTVTVATNEWKYVADLNLELDSSLPLVSCCANEINQVVLNLIVNAAHAIQDKLDSSENSKGVITVRTRQEGDFLAIEVQDTGMGIPEDIMAKIFDPFFTTKEVGKGTGQGLALAHSVIVQNHGGQIECDSVVGKGTTFVLKIPLGSRAGTNGASAVEKVIM